MAIIKIITYWGIGVLRFLGIKLRAKSRKYPIKRDEYGRTARQRAFAAFGEGKKPAEDHKNR